MKCHLFTQPHTDEQLKGLVVSEVTRQRETKDQETKPNKRSGDKAELRSRTVTTYDPYTHTHTHTHWVSEWK